MKSSIYSTDDTKRNPFAEIKFISKGQLWIPAFCLLGFLMAFVMTELLLFGYWLDAQNQTIESLSKLYEGIWKSNLLFNGFAVTMLAAVTNGVQSFWYLYSRRKIDCYHSLPVKRSELFWRRTGVGILYYLVPYVLMVFLAICVGAARGLFQPKIIGMALMMCFLHFLIYLLFYFCTVLVVCVTGNSLMGVLCLGGLMLYGIVLRKLIMGYRAAFYKTFFGQELYGILKFLEEYGSPYCLGSHLLEQYGGGNYLAVLTIAACVTAMIGGLAWMAFLRRPSESAEKPMVYDWISIIVKIMVTVPCGLGVGLIFYMLPYGEAKRVWWILGMVLGTVISHGVLEVVYQMDFQKFWSKKHHLVLVGILVAACAVNYQMDLLKFDAYFPKQEKLAAVNANLSSLSGLNQPMLLQEEDGRYRSIGTWTCQEAVLTGENGVGSKTWQALKKIAERQEAEDKEGYAIPVKYTLKSGREIFREYVFTPEDIYGLIEALYEEGTLREQQTSFLAIDFRYLKNVEGVFANGEVYRLFQEEPCKYQELLSAFSEDVKEADAGELLVQPTARLRMEYAFPVKEDAGSPYMGDFSHIVTVVNVVPAFKRTIAILEETGYPMSMDEVPLEKADITYYKDENSSDAPIEFLCKNEEELKELRKVLVPSELTCSWMSMEPKVYVEYYLKGESENSHYGSILSESMPEFLRKDIEEAGIQ